MNRAGDWLEEAEADLAHAKGSPKLRPFPERIAPYRPERG